MEDKNQKVDSVDMEKKKQVKDKSKENQSPKNDVLTKENLPDATNESTGKTGSGQRQDSN